MNYLQVNNPKDNSPLLCYSPETRYICEEYLILLIHWRKHGNGNSKILRYYLSKTKNSKLADDNKLYLHGKKIEEYQRRTQILVSIIF